MYPADCTKYFLGPELCCGAEHQRLCDQYRDMVIEVTYKDYPREPEEFKPYNLGRTSIGFDHWVTPAYLSREAKLTNPDDLEASSQKIYMSLEPTLLATPMKNCELLNKLND